MRLDTILRLRWLAVLGQLAAIFFVVEQGLDFDLPLIPCLIVIAFSATVNIVLQIAFNPMRRLEPKHAAGLLALMIAELDALLFLTGGMDNPFLILVLAPALIAATALPPRLTLALAAFAAARDHDVVLAHAAALAENSPLDLRNQPASRAGSRRWSQSASRASMPSRRPSSPASCPMRSPPRNSC